MAVKLPDISINRSGTDITVTLDNFEAGDTWNIYVGPNHISNLSKDVANHDQASYTINNTDPEKNYVLRISLNNAPPTASVTILVDNSTETPPYVVVEAKGDTVLTPVTITKAVSWGADLTDLPFIEGQNFLIEWEPSKPIITIGKNQTL